MGLVGPAGCSWPPSGCFGLGARGQLSPAPGVDLSRVDSFDSGPQLHLLQCWRKKNKPATDVKSPHAQCASGPPPALSGGLRSQRGGRREVSVCHVPSAAGHQKEVAGVVRECRGAGGLEREHLCLGVDVHEISPCSNLSFGSYCEKSSLGFDKSVSRAALALATRLEG